MLNALTLGLKSSDHFFSDLKAALAKVADDAGVLIYAGETGNNIFLLNDPSFELPTPEQCPAAVIDCAVGYTDMPGSQYAVTEYLMPVSLTIIHFQPDYPDVDAQRFLDRLRMRTLNYLEDPDDSAPSVGMTISTNDTGYPWWHWRVVEENPRLSFEPVYSLNTRGIEFRFPEEMHGQRVTLPHAYIYSKLGKAGFGVNVP